MFPTFWKVWGVMRVPFQFQWASSWNPKETCVFVKSLSTAVEGDMWTGSQSVQPNEGYTAACTASGWIYRQIGFYILMCSLCLQIWGALNNTGSSKDTKFTAWSKNMDLQPCLSFSAGRVPIISDDLPDSYPIGKLCTEDPISVSWKFSQKFLTFSKNYRKG